MGTGSEISSFIERFKGKYALMDKDGHLGIVKKSQAPIEKETVVIIDNHERMKTEHNSVRKKNLHL